MTIDHGAVTERMPAPSAGAAPEVVLNVAGLRKKYGAAEVVRGLSFEIRRGE